MYKCSFLSDQFGFVKIRTLYCFQIVFFLGVTRIHLCNLALMNLLKNTLADEDLSVIQIGPKEETQHPVYNVTINWFLRLQTIVITHF